MTTRRVQEVSALLKREISLLIKEYLPENLGIVSVIDLKVTPDFKEAKLYISVFDKKKEKDVLIELDKISKEIQENLGKKLRLKFTPKLTFEIDKSQNEINKVEKILQEINNES